MLAFALLFLPLFLWLGPMWLLFYWFAIFFGYAGVGRAHRDRRAADPRRAAAGRASTSPSHRIAGVDSPVVMAAISSADQAYQPDALRRLQELIAVVPDDPDAARARWATC